MTPRPVRGLILGFTLSFVNLAGAFLAVLALGGLGAWRDWQFIGFFGLLEVGGGLAFVFGPNVWRLPVAEANTSNRTAIRFAASTVFIPHWAAGAKCLAGLAMLVYAATRAGIGPATLALPLVVLLIAGAILAVSAAVARLGVARPDLDVIHVVIERPEKPALRLPGISLGGMAIQLVINIGTFPAIKFLRPEVFYRPEIGPSPGMLYLTLVLTLALSALALLAWKGRVAWRAPTEQQREAERAA